MEHTNNSSKGRLSCALGGYLDTKRDDAGFIGGRNRSSPGNQMMQVRVGSALGLGLASKRLSEQLCWIGNYQTPAFPIRLEIER